MLKISDIPEDYILFYDIETDSKFAPYAELRMIGAQIGFNGKPFLIETGKERQWFRSAMQDPDILKVTYNGTSFDNIVLHREGFPVIEEGMHDVYLMLKTIAPWLASWSQKFTSWYFFGDPHFPEMKLHEWMKLMGRPMWEAPKYLLEPYCLHDVFQEKELFLMAWERVQRLEHWDAYLLDLSQGEPYREMMIVGGLYLNEPQIREEIATLQMNKLGWESRGAELSQGRVQNPNSSQQLSAYLISEGFELSLTDNGEFSVKKEEILDIIDLENPEKDLDPVARCAHEIRQVNAVLKYYKNYLAALADSSDSLCRGWIPKQYSISNARTRRPTSNSKYKLNFQNPTDKVKRVQRVPEGWLGVWIDSTQVENVVHIYESQDHARRAAYEADPEWNEYVWLCNRVLGGNRDKKELDNIPSPQFPGWSIYKQFKTVKLSLNFGLGVDHFCIDTGVDKKVGREAFNAIHYACPAIKQLQDRVAGDLVRNGKVRDVFGHIYTGEPNKAYKVVAYLVQGTGTASLPKAQLRSNFDVIRELCGPAMGHVSGIIHDEQEMRLSLFLDPEVLFATLQKLMYNMTTKYEEKFDNIPLRAKLYLSKTTGDERQEFPITAKHEILSFIFGG